MILYLTVIFIAMLIVSLFNILFGLSLLQCEAWFVVVAVVCGVAFQFVVDGLFATLVHLFPKKWFSYDKKIFAVTKAERKFLNLFNVKKWKNLVWELGGLGGFKKSKIENPKDIGYVETFLMECNKGVVTHYIGMFAGYLLILIFPIRFALTVCLPIAFVNMVLNIMPIMVLRYNVPKLQVLHEALLKERFSKTLSSAKVEEHEIK
ncbi:MAG: hypothetical protein IJ817_02840 [Clostridia bacterium]|nr:hypothetical protein [Clostridia bacterium]